MNEITQFQKSGSLIPAINNPYDDQFKDISSGLFLPRVQLMISNSEPVKTGDFPMNHYAFVRGRDQFEDLGKEVDVLIITWRPRALDTSDRSNIRSSFIKESALFKEIQAKSPLKDSKCQYGPEYLVWVPQKSEFATLYMGGKSTRNEANKVHLLMGKAATFKSKLLRNDEYSWQSPYVVPCSTPFEIPSDEAILRESDIFLNPVEQSGEKLVETPQRDR